MKSDLRASREDRLRKEKEQQRLEAKATEIPKGLDGVIYKYNQKYPDEEVLVVDHAKGIQTSKDKNITRAIAWSFSTRFDLILTDKYLVIYEGKVPLDKIVSLQINKLTSPLDTKNHTVLKVSIKNGNHYQFAVPLASKWANQKVLKYTVKQATPQESGLVLFLKLIALLLSVGMILLRFMK